MSATAMNHRSFSFQLAITVSIFCVLPLSFVQADKGGFTVELIHRDSPNSPLFNPSETPSRRLIYALQRSFRRFNHFKPSPISPSTAKSRIISNNGEYLMEISIGTPPVKILAIADTGSDLTWIQCKPCTDCYKQVAPLFDPKTSSTYKDVPCHSTQCHSLGGISCLADSKSADGENCNYTVAYGDGSLTKGVLAMDTVSLGHLSLPKTVFGCGHENNGIFDKHGSGIIGLATGAVSLISQLNSSIGGKFSYCLAPISSKPATTSKMNFGSKAVVSGPGVVSTPLILKPPYSFYFLTLEAMSVGNKRLKFNSFVSSSSRGNIIIDSGTTLTMFPEEFYHRLESTVSQAISLPRAYVTRFPSRLCYKTKSAIGAPTITAHFTGADLKLSTLNTFVRLAEDAVCFGFAPSQMFSLPVFGNLAQMGFLIGYDLEAKTLSFKPTDCTRQ